jgi:hypothetical protein
VPIPEKIGCRWLVPLSRKSRFCEAERSYPITPFYPRQTDSSNSKKRIAHYQYLCFITGVSESLIVSALELSAACG